MLNSCYPVHLTKLTFSDNYISPSGKSIINLLTIIFPPLVNQFNNYILYIYKFRINITSTASCVLKKQRFYLFLSEAKKCTQFYIYNEKPLN